MSSLHIHKKAAAAVAVLAAAPAMFAANSIITSGSASALTYTIPDGYTTIVDANFYDCAASAFSKQFPAEEIQETGLTDAQLAKITSITCLEPNLRPEEGEDLERILYTGSFDGDYVVDTKGLEKMTGLAELSLSTSDDIDLSNNTELLYLRIFSKQIANLDLSYNAMLSTVLVADKALVNIDLSKNIELSELAIFNGTIGNLPSEMEGMDAYHRNLTFERGSLTDIDLTQNTKLETLYITSGSLTDVDLSNNSELWVCALPGNYFTTVPNLNDGQCRYLLVLIGNSIFDLSPFEGRTRQLSAFLQAQKKTVETDSTTYELPPLFTQVKTENWAPGLVVYQHNPNTDEEILTPLYTDQDFILDNATLSADGKSITIQDTTKPASIEIVGGLANGSTLTVVYVDNSEPATDSEPTTDPEPTANSETSPTIKAPNTGFTTDADNDNVSLQNLVVVLCVLVPIAAMAIYGLTRSQARKKF